MRKIIFLFLFILVFFLNSCQELYDAKIEKHVNNINSECPIKLGENHLLKKIEYSSPFICFYVTEKETKYLLSELSEEQKQQLKDSQDFKKKILRICLNNDYVVDELNNISSDIGKRIGLSFKVYIKGETSKEVLKTEISLEDLQSIAAIESEW